ncbi:MAG: cation diffusion facilitator family transporter [Spirochaetia bacterium]|nr:cation diffusion facilitator family transporter [Spirochaetia bacterium]
MDDCCEDAACGLDENQGRQKSALIIVLFINAVMFVVEITAGILANSTALLADSLDMLGDALVYSFSLYVIKRNDRWKAISALIKGGIMAAFGFFVLAQAVYKVIHPQTPVYETIGFIGFLALLANSFCLYILWRHRKDDINMRSVYICSRNDIFANTGVILAGAGVWFTNTQWPDLAIGLVIAFIVLRSSFHVIREAIKIYQK